MEEDSMRIFNTDKTEEIASYDRDKGHLVEDKLVTHIPYSAPVKEEGYYETIAEYPNGGKDVKWVVTKAGQAEVLEHDEEEKILVYVPYTDTELARINAEKTIATNKELLEESDYTIIKFMDSYIKANPTLLEEFANQYPQLLETREGARIAINDSEAVLASIDE